MIWQPKHSHDRKNKPLLPLTIQRNVFSPVYVEYLSMNEIMLSFPAGESAITGHMIAELLCYMKQCMKLCALIQCLFQAYEFQTKLRFTDI